MYATPAAPFTTDAMLPTPSDNGGATSSATPVATSAARPSPRAPTSAPPSPSDGRSRVGGASPSPASRSATPNAATLGYRSDGAFCNARVNTASTAGQASANGRGGSSATARQNASRSSGNSR